MTEPDWISKLVGYQAHYMGDAVYAWFDGYQVWLGATDGLTITNQIALEPSVWKSLIECCESLNYGGDNENKVYEKDIKFLEKRIDTIQTIVSSLATFEDETIKKYVLSSIAGEMSFAFNQGRFGGKPSDEDS